MVLLSVGHGNASARSAQSHTGALAISSDVVASGCRNAGAWLQPHASSTVALAATPHPHAAAIESSVSGPATLTPFPW
ncbi:hypothetical protein AB0C70_39635 [Streptomyces sp. NPDC048564]|uniref:hypothetical protein n=1 Tax=Streptomyces sp. NPDC048564 TaxID=3155760 RepID=UPI003423E3AC